jgi:hypothetical protein
MDLSSSGVALNRSGPMALEDFEQGLAMDLGSDPFDDNDPLAELEAGLPSLGGSSGGSSSGDELLAELEPAAGSRASSDSGTARAAPRAKTGKPGAGGKRGRLKSSGAQAPAGEKNYSVFVGKSKSPAMVALLSEVMGIPTDQAKHLARKPIIPVAKNIGKADAESIKAKFAAANISARITSKS